MIIVADTSALVALSTCNALWLLEELFGTVAVPQIVFDECTIENKAESEALQSYLEGKVVELNNPLSLDLPSSLGAGETAAMLLVKELQAELLLIDDNRARKLALMNDIKVVGSLGILLIAKQKSKVNSISGYLEKLQNSDLYISQKLLEEVRRRAAE